MKKHRNPDLQDMGEAVASIITQVAGRRIVQILEFVTDDKIKPLERENERLRALLTKHGIEA